MTKSLANKLRLKERLYTIRMQEGTSIQSHLDEFNSILIDLENLEVKLEDEDKAVLLVVSLPKSYKHFKEIMLYGNHEILDFDDVKSNLLSKEKFDSESSSNNQGEGLIVKGRNLEKSHDFKKSGKSRSISRNKYQNKSCKYCKKQGHEVSECYKLKNKKSREGNDQTKHVEKPDEVSIAENDSEGDVYLAFDLDDKAKGEWILDTGCTFHMCPHKDLFSTFEPLENGVVFMGNNTQCKVLGKGNINLRTHDGVIRTLTWVRYIPGLKRNLISLGTLESLGYRYSAEGGVLKVLQGALVIMKANRKGNLYALEGSTTVVSTTSITAKPTVSTSTLWHYRLAHMGEKGMSILSK